MGIKLFSSGRSRNYEPRLDTYKPRKPLPPDPDPYKFKIDSVEKVGPYTIVEATYEGCTTFEGRKLMLCRETVTVRRKKPLDPHLLHDYHTVMARFEPTPEGWALARLCANALVERKE